MTLRLGQWHASRKWQPSSQSAIIIWDQDNLERGQSDDDSAPVLMPQAPTPHHPQNPRGTSHLPFPSPSTLLPSLLFLFGPPWSPSENVVPIHLPRGDPRRSPYRLLQSSPIDPVPDAVPGDSGCRPRPQLRYYLYAPLRPRGWDIRRVLCQVRPQSQAIEVGGVGQKRLASLC